MKKCPKCGAQLPNDANFCTECGASLSNIAIDNEEKQATETFEPDGTVKETSQPKDEKQQSTQHSINVDKAKENAVSYWKWLLKSWTHPTDTKASASKWFGISSIIIEIFLFCASFFTLDQKLISYINKVAGNTVNTLASILGSQSQNTGNLTNFNAFGTSFEIFIILILFDAAILGAVYGINCWVFKEKEGFFDFVNRFAHYTNVILIVNVLLFLFSLVSNTYSYKLILTVFVISILFYILGMTMTITTRKGAQRLDRLYGAFFVLLIIFIAFIILTSIGGAAINNVIKVFTNGLGN